MRILALFIIIIIILKKSFTGDSDEYFCSSALLFGKSGSVSSELMLFDLFEWDYVISGLIVGTRWYTLCSPFPS